jgi:ABC-2 type transport system ATP-binding protein
VRTPHLDELASVLAERGASFRRDSGFLEIDGVSTDEVGELAATHRLTIHELFNQRSSLEAAFMEMTRDSVEYHAHDPEADDAPAGDPVER